MRTFIIETIKSTVPSLVSDDIFRQLKELSRTELKDLCSEMSIFKNELRENKIRDARGILWFKLRNRYNINPNGTERLKKNPQNEYPKYKKISEEIHAKTQDDAASKEEQYTQAALPFEDDKPSWWPYWSDTINDIISNYRVGDREINEVEKKHCRICSMRKINFHLNMTEKNSEYKLSQIFTRTMLPNHFHHYMMVFIKQ